MTLDYARHKAILLRILKEIYADTSIAPYLGFKGGTAAHLFYGLDRDSVDLDFDLLDESKEQIVFEKIQEIASHHGEVVESRIKRFNLLNVISYAAGVQKVKIEVNRRSFGSRYKPATVFGIAMLVMVKEDMFAHKLMALVERVSKTSRDIYDAWFFLQNMWPINESIIEQRAGRPFKEVLQQCIEQLEKMNNRRILTGLGESLSKPRKDWARDRLRADTVFLLKLMLDVAKRSK